MMEVQKISEETKISDSTSVESALKRMRNVPAHALEYYLVLRETLAATSGATRQTITLAQVEFNRRVNNRTRWLAITTTLVSGAVGLVGVALGVYLAHP